MQREGVFVSAWRAVFVCSGSVVFVSAWRVVFVCSGRAMFVCSWSLFTL
ncbi:hypothetical protein [Methanimicrococcus hongohii]|nr:hypothetical protein [Methanimicrococcus sp. Hf6]